MPGAPDEAGGEANLFKVLHGFHWGTHITALEFRVNLGLMIG